MRLAPVRSTMRLRTAVLAAATAGATWWLFADTLDHYLPHPPDPNVIRFSHFGSYQDFELWQEIIDAFETSNPGMRVEQEYVPGWYGRYDTKIRQQILSGTLPQVVLVQLGPFAGMAEHFAELDDFLVWGDDPLDLEEDIDPTAIDAFSVRDPKDGQMRLRGMPIAGGDLLIYCNTECFERASTFLGRQVTLPSDEWSMEDFAELARTLTCDFDGDGQSDQFGFWQPRWVYYLPFLWSHGARLTDEHAREWLFTGPHAERAVSFYRDLVRTWRVCPAPADVPQLIQDVGFLTGKVAMCVNGPWFQPFLDATRLRDTYSIATIPRGAGGSVTRVTWDGLCIAKGLSQAQARAAWRFVRFCLSLTVQEMIAETGRSIPALLAAQPAFDRAGTDDRRHKFVQALASARLQPRLPRFSELDRAIERHLQRFIADDTHISPARFLEDLATDSSLVGALNPSRESLK